MTASDRLVEDYLQRLEAAAAVLPPERRAELLADIGEHIAAGRQGADDEASVVALLSRLGPPEEIVAAEHEDAPPGWGPAPLTAAPAPAPAARGTGLELAAVLMLTAGSFLPVVGWLVGVGLLWASPRWRRGEKALGTLVVPLGPGGVLLYGALLPFALGGEECTSSPVVGPAPPPPPGDLPPGGAPTPSLESVVCTSTGAPAWVVVPLLALALLLPVLVAVVLYRRAVARARAEAPPAPRHAAAVGTSPWGALEVSAVLVLAVGALVVPVVPLLVGLFLALLSPQWTRRVKAVAGAVLALPLVAAPATYLTPGLMLPGGNEALVAMFILGPVLGLVAAGVLAGALLRRPAARPAT